MNNIAFFVTLFCSVHVECAKILGVFPAPGYSQFILAEVLMKEVAKRGHEVIVISPHEPQNSPPNYKTILVRETLEDGTDINLFELGPSNLFTNIKTTYLYGNRITESTLKNQEVQKLLNSNEHFDLVIVEQFFNDALKGFAAHFGTPLVLFSSMGLTEWNKECMGVPAFPSFNAISYTSFTNDMNFFQRITNIAGTIFDYLYRNFVFYPAQNEYLSKYFPKPINFNEIVNNASLMLLNSHVTTSENVLLPYNMIEIGGFHVVKDKLSKDIQDYLDSANHGVILFSLGSNLRSADLSADTLSAIFTIFGNLKQKVLWKFETDLPNKPDNVLISKWLNQKDILAHPNLKLFITHGGMLSTTEAIFHGVPMVGIPVFADQRMNIARAKRMGIAQLIPFVELSNETLSSAINEVLNNPNYQSNIGKMSKIMKDRVRKPLDLAIYWIEHAIRNHEVHFETATSKLNWFEVYMIDILVFFLFSLLVLCVLIKCIYVFVRKSKCKQNHISSKKKEQ